MRTLKWERWWAVINCVKDALRRARNLVLFKQYIMSLESVIHLSLTLVGDYVSRDKQSAA